MSEKDGKELKLFVGGYYDDRLFEGEQFEGKTAFDKSIDTYTLSEVLKLGFVESVAEWYEEWNKKDWNKATNEERIEAILKYTNTDEIAGLVYCKTEEEAQRFKDNVIKEVEEIEKLAVCKGKIKDKEGNFREYYLFGGEKKMEEIVEEVNFKDVFVKTADELYSVMSDLNGLWMQDRLEDFCHDKLCNKYPFSRSFDEEICEINRWIEDKVLEKISAEFSYPRKGGSFDDFSGDGTVDDVKESLIKVSEKFEKLADSWDKGFAQEHGELHSIEGYPFNKPFREICQDVRAWVEENKIKCLERNIEPVKGEIDTSLPVPQLFEELGCVCVKTESGIGYRKEMDNGHYIEIYGEKHNNIPTRLDESTSLLYFESGGKCECSVAYNNPVEAIYDKEMEIFYKDNKLMSEIDTKIAKMLMQEGRCADSVKGILMDYSSNVPSKSDEARKYLNRTVKDAEKELKAESAKKLERSR